MQRRCILLLIAMVMISQVNCQTNIVLPISQQLAIKLTLSLQRLQQVLATFNTRYENKFEMYRRVYLTTIYLNELTQALYRYNNVIAGYGNFVNGCKNFIIGNWNNISGSRNWIFVSSFTGYVNGDLLIGKWRVQIDKSSLILINPKFAISFLDDVRNADFKTKYASNNRQLLKWNKWANPTNNVADQYWTKYQGYNDWKVNQWPRQTQHSHQVLSYGTVAKDLNQVSNLQGQPTTTAEPTNEPNGAGQQNGSIPAQGLQNRPINNQAVPNP